MEKHKILIAKFDENRLDKLCNLLNKDKFDIIILNNGIEVVKNTIEIFPDLIILGTDIVGMNPYQICRLLKSDPITKFIPIIVHTSEEVKKQKSNLDYLPEKTIYDNCDPNDFINIVDKLINENYTDNIAKLKIEAKNRYNDTYIISKLNTLLDNKCYEAALFSDLTDLVKNIFSYDDLALAVMDIFFRIVDYSVAMVSVITEEDSKLTIHLHKDISNESYDKIKDIALNKFKKEITDFNASNTMIKVVSENRIINNNDLPKTDIDTILFNVFSNNGILKKGFMLFGKPGHKISSHEQELLNTIINEACIILENSWLYSKLYKNIKNLSITDGLTGIYNHKYIIKLIKQEFNRAKRYGHNISIIMFDIDHFKMVNDTFGHQTGDVILREISSIIQEAVRKTDFIGRYGGEEFTIILTETNCEKALLFAERLRKNVESYDFFNPSDPLKVTVSMGVVSYPSDKINDSNTFIKYADESLYQAKGTGRNKVCVYAT